MRTIFIRDTCDNFRACSKYPTEQKLVNCTHGQFISTLWRGSEIREKVTTHVKIHYDEMTYLVHNGVVLQIHGSKEKFNVILFLVADLCFVKEVLEHCSCIQTYGCFYCKLKIGAWASPKILHGEAKSIENMRAGNELGPTPKKESS